MWEYSEPDLAKVNLQWPSDHKGSIPCVNLATEWDFVLSVWGYFMYVALEKVRGGS